MIIFQHKRQPWRTLSGAYQRRGWFFHHVRTFVNGCQTVVRLPRHTWRVGMLPIVDYHLVEQESLDRPSEERERITTSFKRETYHVGGADVISYELADAYEHVIQLDPSETLDLLTWLDTLRGQIIRDMHPESAPSFTEATRPDASTQFHASWIDDLEI